MEIKKEEKPLFVIDNDPIVDWPVIVKLPTDGGEFNEHQFTVSMRVLAPKEYEELFKEAPGSMKEVPNPEFNFALPDDGNNPAVVMVPLQMSEIVELNAPIFARLITGWKDVRDKAGHEVVYTPEALAGQIIGPRGQSLSAGLWRAINEIRYGARLGN